MNEFLRWSNCFTIWLTKWGMGGCFVGKTKALYRFPITLQKTANFSIFVWINVVMHKQYVLEYWLSSFDSLGNIGRPRRLSNRPGSWQRFLLLSCSFSIVRRYVILALFLTPADCSPVPVCLFTLFWLLLSVSPSHLYFLILFAAVFLLDFVR